MFEPEPLRTAEDRANIPCRADVIEQDCHFAARSGNILGEATRGAAYPWSADANRDVCLTHADGATRAEGLPRRERIAEPARVTYSDLVGVIWHEVIIHATIYTCIG